jgi:ribosome-binding factor A
MSTIRQEQVQNLLVEEVSEMLLRELKDPRLGFITVTGAEITRDLRHAKVFVSIMGSDDEKKGSMAALRSATGMIRSKFGRVSHLRVTPEIEFRQDDAIDRGARIFELLKQIEVEAPASAATKDSSKAKDGNGD